MPPRGVAGHWPLVVALAWAGPAAAQPPPKVVLVGDSIRLGYAPLVAGKLDGKAVVVSPKANGGDSTNVLKHLDEWVIREKPDEALELLRKRFDKLDPEVLNAAWQVAAKAHALSRPGCSPRRMH